MPKYIGFGYMGGKLSHLNWLLALILTAKMTTYVELFGGSAAVILNKKMAAIEVYNDLNSELVTFFRVLRNNGAELKRLLELTPFSREAFVNCANEDPKRTDMEIARCFFVKLLQVRLSAATDRLTKGRWNYATSRKGNDRDGIRCGRAIGVARYFNKIDILPQITERLKQIQIEHYPALKVLDIYDSPHTFFYADPPYPFESRSKHNIYKYEMSNDDHRKLAWRLNNVQGRVAVSGYDCDLMNEMYDGWNVHKERAKGVNYNQSSIGSTRQEVLWTNYDINNLAAPLIRSPWAIGDSYGQQEMKLSYATP